MDETPSLTETILTGKYRFKKAFWTGSMVLWVQEQIIFYPNLFDTDLKSEHIVWRKADELDVPQIIEFIKNTTPKNKELTINEFHVGFNYEALEMDSSRYFNKGEIWVKHTYNLKSPRLYKIKQLIDKGLIRRPQ